MLKPNRVLDFRPICPLSLRERVRERAVSRRLTFRFLGFVKNLLKGRLKGCPVNRLHTLKTSEANFAKTER